MIVMLLCLAGRVRADDPPASIEALNAQVEELKAQIETLKAENAALKDKLASAQKATTRPTTQTVFELGEPGTLGGYQFKTPRGWAYQDLKENKLQAVYRSPDKLGVLRVVIHPKGSAPADSAAKYGQTMVLKLKEDFLKNKTEVIAPPAVIADPRFFCKIRERIKVKGEKSADQTHLYLMLGKDAIELSVLTTAESPEAIAATQKLADDVLLSFKAN